MVHPKHAEYCKSYRQRKKQEEEQKKAHKREHRRRYMREYRSNQKKKMSSATRPAVSDSEEPPAPVQSPPHSATRRLPNIGEHTPSSFLSPEKHAELWAASLQRQRDAAISMMEKNSAIAKQNSAIAEQNSAIAEKNSTIAEKNSAAYENIQLGEEEYQQFLSIAGPPSTPLIAPMASAAQLPTTTTTPDNHKRKSMSPQESTNVRRVRPKQSAEESTETTVYYVSDKSSGLAKRAQVVAVHLDDVFPYYTISFDGREKQTTEDRLTATSP